MTFEEPVMTEVSIEITYDCPMRCIYCSSRASHPTRMGNELTCDEIAKILRDAWDKCGAEVFSISGGEPLVHPKFFEILDEANRIGYELKLYTSGAQFKQGTETVQAISTEYARRLVDYPDMTVIFDLQGVRKETVNFLMGIENAYDIVWSAIKSAMDVGLPIEAHFVPTKPNWLELTELIDEAKLLGIRKLSILRFVPQGRGRDNQNSLALSTEQFRAMVNILYLAKKLHPNLLRIGHPMNFCFLLEPSSKKEIAKCRGGYDAPLIKPDGRVDVCPAWKELPEQFAAGNIRKQSIDEIWYNSPLYQSFRRVNDAPEQFLKGKCLGCEYLTSCAARCTAQRILAHGDMYDTPDPMCWYLR